MDIQLVADFFISSPERESGDLISPLKLQKLAYYAQAWHLAIEGIELFETDFQAWVHGPVALPLFVRFADHKYSPISVEFIQSEQSLKNMPLNISEHLSEVWDIYGELSAKALENLTHSEAPWLEARRGLGPLDRSSKVISKQRMKSFYGEMLNRGEEEQNT